MSLNWIAVVDGVVTVARWAYDHLIKHGHAVDAAQAAIKRIVDDAVRAAVIRAQLELEQTLAAAELDQVVRDLAEKIHIDMKDLFEPLPANLRTIKPLGVVTELSAEEMAAYQAKRQAHLMTFACKACGAAPDELGYRRHVQGAIGAYPPCKFAVDTLDGNFVDQVDIS